MAVFFKSLFVVTIGVALGLFATWFSIEQGHGFGAVKAGPWLGWPRAGTTSADPYARAAISRTAELPLGLAEGLSFLARSDSSGRPLRRECIYTISPPVPAARYWTISVASPQGVTLTNDFGRTGFTSREIIRTGPGRFSIKLAREVQSGNWLPMAAEGPFVLVLRLYDTPVSSAASALKGSDMPSITRGACA